MILCCKHCGNCRETNHLAENCDYCGNEMVQLLSDEELSQIVPTELPQIIEAMRAGYRYGNPDYDEKLWYSRAKKEEIQRAENEKKELDYREKHHMVTTGFQFEGYEIVSYLGIVGETAGFRHNNMFSNNVIGVIANGTSVVIRKI